MPSMLRNLGNGTYPVKGLPKKTRNSLISLHLECGGISRIR